MKNKKFIKSRKQLVVIGAIVLLIGVGAAYAFAVGNSDHQQQQASPSNEANEEEHEAANQQTPQATANTSENEDESNKSSSAAEINSNTDLQPPYGAFVSNHAPNLSGKPAPNTMSSICRTTPGAICEIRFSMGETVKYLEPKTADSNGTASWEWKLQDVGLSEGSWQVKAVATLNGQEKQTVDTLSLDVRP